jgi:hypothetical protein
MQGLNAPVALASGSRLGACRGCSRVSHSRAPQICRRLRVTVRAESVRGWESTCVCVLPVKTRRLTRRGPHRQSSEKMRMAQQEMRDFGARDPTTAELDFNFQERVRGTAPAARSTGHEHQRAPSFGYTLGSPASGRARCSLTPARNT